MGSKIELNDTLQITQEQGFPEELDFEKHKTEPLCAEDLAERVFEFKNKPDIRAYQQVPVRNFLVENVDDKWRYWGMVHVLEVTHDYEKQTTSGKYKIVYIYTPEEMQQAYGLMDRREDKKL